jgi:hypothetical protein
VIKKTFFLIFKKKQNQFSSLQSQFNSSFLIISKQHFIIDYHQIKLNHFHFEQINFKIIKTFQRILSHFQFILTNQNLLTKTLFSIFNIKIISIYSKNIFYPNIFFSKHINKCFSHFFIKPFFKLSNQQKHFSLLLLFHLNQIFLSFSSIFFLLLYKNLFFQIFVQQLYFEFTSNFCTRLFTRSTT